LHDVKIQQLDVGQAISDSDAIVLAVPTLIVHKRKFTLPQSEDRRPLEMEEVEVSLSGIVPIKGSAIGDQVKFVYYNGTGSAIGPPQGPAGALAKFAIFFLRRRADGTFRSVVDYYRPDIPTPWLRSPPKIDEQTSIADRVAGILLRVRSEDSVEVSAKCLLIDVAIVKAFYGFLNTLELLTRLESETSLSLVRARACAEIEGWYSFELPETCIGQLSAKQQSDRKQYVDRMRTELETGRVRWIEERIGSTDRSDIQRYLRLLVDRSPEAATRKMAARLLRQP